MLTATESFRGCSSRQRRRGHRNLSRTTQIHLNVLEFDEAMVGFEQLDYLIFVAGRDSGERLGSRRVDQLAMPIRILDVRIG